LIDGCQAIEVVDNKIIYDIVLKPTN